MTTALPDTEPTTSAADPATQARAFAEELSTNLKTHAVLADQNGWMRYYAMQLPAGFVKNTPPWTILEAACLNVGLQIDHANDNGRTIKIKFVQP